MSEQLPYVHPSNVVLQYALAINGPYTQINNLRTIAHPTLTKGRAAVTSISATNKFSRKRLGWLQTPEFRFTVYRDQTPNNLGPLNALPNQFGTLFTIWKAESLTYWQLILLGGLNQIHYFTALIGDVTPLNNLDRDSDEEIFDEYTLVLTDDVPTYTDPVGGAD